MNNYKIVKELRESLQAMVISMGKEGYSVPYIAQRTGYSIRNIYLILKKAGFRK